MFALDPPHASITSPSTVAQRGACYDRIASTIEHGLATPVSLRAIRFFHAARIVTLPSMLGIAEPSALLDIVLKLTRLAHLSPETRRFVSACNARLFTLNMEVLDKLVHVWRQPQSPMSNGRDVAIDAWDFDLQMVEREQAEVTLLIAALHPSASTLAELDRLYAVPACRWPIFRRLHPMGASFAWTDAIRQRPFSFRDERDRIITGKAIVAMLHRRSLADLLTAIAPSDPSIAARATTFCCE